MKNTKYINGFTILVALACLLTLTLNMINSRFHLGDFKVYYTAATNFFSGGQVYLVSFYEGSGVYKYSPASLFLFLPYIFLGYLTASVIHFIILGSAFWYAFTIIRQLIRRCLLPIPGRHDTLLTAISFSCILVPFTRELYLGNINILLLMLCLLSLRSYLAGKDLKGSIFLAIAILMKPYLMILLLPLILRSRWKSLMWLGIFITCGLLIPFIFPGPREGFRLYADWISTIRLHGEGFPGMTSLDYIASRHLLTWPSWGFLIPGVAILTGATYLILRHARTERHPEASFALAGRNLTFEWFLLLALIPNLISTDWVVLLLSAPVVSFIIFYIADTKKYAWIAIILFPVLVFGANSDDLLGRELSRNILHSGMMGVANFLLVIFSVLFFNINRQLMTKP